MSEAERGGAEKAIPDMRTRAPRWLRSPGAGLRYQVYCRAYALACAVRLSLPDALQEEWLLPGLVYWLGIGLLAFNGCVAGWLLCAIGAAVPIFTLSDQLTQSAYLLWCAVAALACWVGGAAGRVERLDLGLATAVRLGTMLVYASASLHKLNVDFFDPAMSCANGGLALLLEQANAAELASWLNIESPWWPRLFVVFELGVVLLMWLRPAVGVLAAAALHLPLTIIFAPSFVFTMMSGWVCFFSAEQLRLLWRRWRRRWRQIVVVGLALFGISRVLFFSNRWNTDPDWCLKEAILWLLFVGLFDAITMTRTNNRWGGRGVWTRRAPISRRLTVLVLLFVANSLTPYVGIQFHHTGAMLSNLRIDAGCYNSLLFPESARLFDPYVRIDSIGFKAHRATAGSAAHVTARLWSVSALWRARQRWCRVHTEALPMAGMHDGRSFTVTDFCGETGWVFGEPRMSGMRRFQTNLMRKCPQRCIH